MVSKCFAAHFIWFYPNRDFHLRLSFFIPLLSASAGGWLLLIG